MLIFETPAGDYVHRYNKAVVVCFKGKRNVLSTSPLNGGYREDLVAVFNHSINPGAGMAYKLKAPTYVEHLALMAEELGFDRKYTAGIGTAALMENLAIETSLHKNFAVTALVTGGVEVNGGRVGDPASYEEVAGKAEKFSGTINIIVEVNANLNAATLTRALITATEAKTAALQELMAGSNYSTGLATGSGTDSAIMISNANSAVSLTNAGQHSKLGELIGVVVKTAVKEALYKQTGLSPKYQHSMLKRFKRYGLNEESLWCEYLQLTGNDRSGKLEKPAFINNIHILDRQDAVVTSSSLYIHLLDQLTWQLLSQEEVREAAVIILENMQKTFGINKNDNIQLSSAEDNFEERMIRCFAQAMAQAAGGM